MKFSREGDSATSQTSNTHEINSDESEADSALLLEDKKIEKTQLVEERLFYAACYYINLEHHKKNHKYSCVGQSK